MAERQRVFFAGGRDRLITVLDGITGKAIETTGVARRADLGGVTLPTTNGILVHGRTLYAPRMNDLGVLRLDPTGHNARPARTVTDARFGTPCAAAVHGNRLHLPDSRFPQPPQQDLPYNAGALSLPLQDAVTGSSPENYPGSAVPPATLTP